MIACDDVLGAASQGASQHGKVVGVTQSCRDNSGVCHQQRGVFDQGDEVVDVHKRKMVAILEMWTGKGFSQFEEKRKTGHEIEIPCPPGVQNLCRSSARRDQTADENIGVENCP